MTSHTRSIKSRRPSLKVPREVRNAARSVSKGIRFIWARPLIVTAILLVLAGVLLNLVINQAFKPYFNCAYLVSKSLNTDVFCQGYSFNIDLGFKSVNIPIIPALKAVDKPLEVFRQFISWDIIIFFALLSLVFTYIAAKMGTFVRFIMTEEGRKIVLTNVSIWLLFFIFFCSLFYFKIVR